MTDDQEALAEATGTVIGEFIKELRAEINTLRTEMKEFCFKGAFQEGETYRRGNFVSQGGAVYYCAVDTGTRPGIDNKSYLLAVPRARDGRDGKDAPPPPAQRTVRSAR